MKARSIIVSVLLAVLMFNCSNVDYPPEFIEQTSGRYLFTDDEVMEVYYKENKLFLKWREGEMKPVIIDNETFFIPDMYKKLRFSEHPETKERYLSIVDPEDEDKVTYDYLKLASGVKLPSEYLEEKNYEKALEGYLEIKKQDSTSVLIAEYEFNSLGYRHLRDKEYEDAIEVFKINVVLHPDSDNVYDSLAEAYLRSGDSTQAFTNYSKALELNSENVRAIRYIEAYNGKED